MGDRIVIDITDGTNHTPSFYGHWCGLRAVKVLNDLVRTGKNNGINSLLCNFVTEIMENRPQEYSYYLYNHGEAEGAADYDNYTWCLNANDRTWTTSEPSLEGRTLTLDEADDYVRRCRPCLYRKCKCFDYGKAGCALKFYETQNRGQERT